MVMRPKSIATVVAVLPGIPVTSSTGIAAEVISASVVSGAISEIAPTMVVLPTPKPPTIDDLRPPWWVAASSDSAFDSASASGGAAAFRRAAPAPGCRDVGDHGSPPAADPGPGSRP